MKRTIDVYTDGSCLVQERIGGWAVVSEDFIFYGRKSNTTNNEMELYSIFKGLSHAMDKYDKINVFSDSEYVINILTKWAYDWETRNWQKRTKGKIKNLELIKEIFKMVKNNSKVNFYKVKSHSGNEMNELADSLAYKMMKTLQ